MSDADYAAAMATYEAAKIDESKRVAMRALYFPVPPESWDMEDLEAFVGRFLAVLPPFERFWHIHLESKCGKLKNGRRGHDESRFEIRIATSDYDATILLPAFPADALAEWIESRHFFVSIGVSEDSVRRAAAAWAGENRDAA